MWKTSMINTKKQIKYCFKIKNNITLDDTECEKRVRYIIFKMSERGYETKCWFKDCMKYIEDTGGWGFDEGDYVCYNLLWEREDTSNRYKNCVAN